MGNKKTITMKDVADYSGVAKSTVSHVINGTATISEETRNKVLKAIEELKYKPNALARSLRKNKSNTIGLIVPDIANEFYSTLTKGVMNVAYEQNYTVVICSTEYNLEREKMLVDSLLCRGSCHRY